MPIIPSSPGDWRDDFEGNSTRSVRETRHQARRMCHIPIRFWADGDPQERSAVIRNLSEIGAFLETDPLPVGTRLRLRLVLKNGVVMRPVEVMWQENPGPSARCRKLWGIGVRFLTRAGAVGSA